MPIRYTTRINIRKEAVNKSLAAANRRAAVEVARRARQLVGVESGKLRSSIRVTPGRSPSYNVEAGRSPRLKYSLAHHNGWRSFAYTLPQRKRRGQRGGGGKTGPYVFTVGSTQFVRYGPLKVRKKAFRGTKFLTKAAASLGFRVNLR